MRHHHHHPHTSPPSLFPLFNPDPEKKGGRGENREKNSLSSQNPKLQRSSSPKIPENPILIPTPSNQNPKIGQQNQIQKPSQREEKREAIQSPNQLRSAANPSATTNRNPDTGLAAARAQPKPIPIPAGPDCRHRASLLLACDPTPELEPIPTTTVVLSLYLLSALGRIALGATVAYTGLCLFYLYNFAQNSQLIDKFARRFFRIRDSAAGTPDAI